MARDELMERWLELGWELGALATDLLEQALVEGDQLLRRITLEGGYDKSQPVDSTCDPTA